MSRRTNRGETTSCTQTSTANNEGGCGPVRDAVKVKADTAYSKILDEQPLSQHFPFDYMFESYVWKAVFLTAFTLGVRFGGLSPVESATLTVLPRPLLFLILYVASPPGCMYLNKKYDVDYTVAERRVLLVVVSLLLGIGSGVFNSHYYLIEGPPSYFMPGLIGLSVQVLGPHLGKSRRELLLASVGSALVLGIALAGISGVLTLTSLLSLCLSSITATISLQIVIADIIKGEADMTESHITSVSIAVYSHLLFSRLFGTYEEIPSRHTRLSLRRAILN